MTDNAGRTPVQNKKRIPPTSWAFIAALLGAGAIPCPGCGTPLGFHILPLAAIFLAIRAFARRGGRSAKFTTPPPVAEMESMAPEIQNRDGERA